MPPPEGENLERDIFGDGSELSSEEDDAPQPRPRLQRRPAEDEPVPSSAESSDAYVQARQLKQKRRVKRREDDEPRRTQKKRKRKQFSQEDLNDLPPEKANKLRLDMQFDAILKPKKANRQKKRKKDDEEILDRFADEEVSRLREAMLGAAADDEQANRDKHPATNKLKLLPQVMEVLRKQSLSQSIVDNNLLEGVRRWLEPLPDRSLPALNIQRDFFPILRRMEFIDNAVLKESGLGRIILFYTKCKRVTPDVQRVANELVSSWSRPIIKRSASYRDRVVPIAADDGAERNNERLNAILARAKEGEKNRIRKNAVMIPEKNIGTYTVAPRMGFSTKGNSSVDNDIARRKVNAERLKTLSRKMATRP